MKLLVAFLLVLSLLVCLPAAACPPQAQAAFGAGYGAGCAAPVSSFGAGGYGMPMAAAVAPAGYGAMVAPVAALPVQTYGMVNSFGVAAPLSAGYSVGAFGAPVVNNVTVVRHRPGLFGRFGAARRAFRRGF